MINPLITKRKLQQSTTGYTILIVLILVIGGYFGYQNFTEYQATRVALETEQNQLNELRAAADSSKTDFMNLKKELDVRNDGLNQSIEKIFPSNEDFTELARKLDSYFRETTITGNPMFLSDLRFNQPRDEKDKDYGVLQFSMSLSGDEDGFKNFLNQIEKSGDINEQSRLLDVNSMNISFQNESRAITSEDTVLSGDEAVAELNQAKLITATLNLKAFFQKSIEEQK